jgi:bifunctional non-homologous end joining protein LigD
VATSGTTSATSSNAPERSEPALIDRPLAGPGWLHEVRHDGFRIFAGKRGDRAQIWSRRGADFTYRFPTIAEAARGLALMMNIGKSAYAFGRLLKAFPKAGLEP